MKTWKKVCLISLLSLLALFLFVSCGEEKAATEGLETYLTALQKGDDKTAEKLQIDKTDIPSTEDAPSSEENQKAMDEIADIVMGKMAYQIGEAEKISDTEVHIQVQISNVDLIKTVPKLSDPMMDKVMDSILAGKEPDEDSIERWSIDLLKEQLQAKDAKRIQKNLKLTMQKKDDVWKAVVTNDVASAISGYRVETAEEDLEKAMTKAMEDAMKNMLKREQDNLKQAADNLFSALKKHDTTAAAKYAVDLSVLNEKTDMDKALNDIYFKQMDYKVLSAAGDNPMMMTVEVEITGLDLVSVAPIYAKKCGEVIQEAQKNGKIQDQAYLNAEFQKAMLASVQDPGVKQRTSKVSLLAQKTNTGWKIMLDENFANALLGGRTEQWASALDKELAKVMG